MRREEINQNIQYYKLPTGQSIILNCIDRNYDNYRAKRFRLFGSNQNIWIPNCYLLSDGTLKNEINLGFIFSTPKTKYKIALAIYNKKAQKEFNQYKKIKISTLYDKKYYNKLKEYCNNES